MGITHSVVCLRWKEVSPHFLLLYLQEWGQGADKTISRFFPLFLWSNHSRALVSPEHQRLSADVL